MDIKVSMTQFIDFTLVPDSQKLSKVREIKYASEYQPAFDYWKQMRDSIVSIHRDNTDLSCFNKLLRKVDIKKQNNYARAIAGYIKFHNKHSFDFFNPPASNWLAEGLTISVNPELGLYIDGKPHLVKLYFKQNTTPLDVQLTRRKADEIAYLMWETLHGDCPKHTKMAFLNVSRGQLIVPKLDNADQKLSLTISAKNFLNYWEFA